MRNPERTAPRLEDRHVKELGFQIASEINVSLIVAEAPRAMIDLNRSVDDIDWGMVSGERPNRFRHSSVNRRARNGLGLIPRRIPAAGEIWRGPIARTAIEDRITQIHQPYHRALGDELQRIRDKFGTALLFDLHSMPPLKRQALNDQAPEFVIGDRFGASSDNGLVDLALGFLSGSGRRVAHNRPYAGGYVLDLYGQPARGIHALQLEVCRSLYLDKQFDQPSPRLPAVAQLITRLLSALGHELDRLGEPPHIAQAAE